MKKQFIAGAVCPECHQVDKIYVTYANAEQAADPDAQADVAICNACGYRSKRPDGNEPQHSVEAQDEVSVVRIMPGSDQQ